MSNFANSINFNDELLLSLPAQLQQYVNNVGDYNNESFLPLTSQNVGEKAKELEKILTDERKTNDEFKKFYKALKTDHTRYLEIKFNLNSLHHFLFSKQGLKMSALN